MLEKIFEILLIFSCNSENKQIPRDKDTLFGSSALPGKMMFVRMIENNSIDAYLG